MYVCIYTIYVSIFHVIVVFTIYVVSNNILLSILLNYSNILFSTFRYNVSTNDYSEHAEQRSNYNGCDIRLY